MLQENSSLKKVELINNNWKLVIGAVLTLLFLFLSDFQEGNGVLIVRTIWIPILFLWLAEIAARLIKNIFVKSCIVIILLVVALAAPFNVINLFLPLVISYLVFFASLITASFVLITRAKELSQKNSG